MKLVIIRKGEERADLKFAIDLPEIVGKVYKEDFLKEHFIFYLEMALADLAHPNHVPILVKMNNDFLLKKAKVVCVLDNKDE